MSISFENRVAVVTGAGAGLGRAHAKLLAARGARVVVNDPGSTLDDKGGAASTADAVVEEIRAAGGEAVANYASVAEREAAASIVETALETYGRLDIVVNNAGILRDKSFAKMALDDFELVMRVHLLGTAFVTKAAWPHLMERKYGRIVFTTSGSGLVGNYEQSNYGAAKTGMMGLMNCLKFEGERNNIKINMISPVAATRMTENIIDAKAFDKSQPEHVSPAVAWLSSEACNVSGEIVVAAAGYFAAVKLMRTAGVVLGGADPASIEAFAGAADQIFDFATAKPFARTLDESVKQAIGLV